MDLLLGLQALRTPVLTSIQLAITFLGNEEFYMIAIPLIYWMVDKRFGWRFSLVFIGSVWINSVLKDLLQLPRPSGAGLIPVIAETSYGFPSGHAQGSLVFWGYIALELRRRWAYVGAALVAALVAFSRLYLGVHWLGDVFGGAAIGLVILGLACWLRRLLSKVSPARALRYLVGLAPLALLIFYREPGGVKVVGFLLGLNLGYVLDADYLGYQERADAGRQGLKAVLGLAVLFALRTALKSVLPAGAAFDLLRYTVMGLWGAFLGPWAFTRLGLTSTRSNGHRSR